MTKTERAKYVFRVKEFVDGTPWIAFEPNEDNLSILNNGLLGFDLPKGTNINSAQKISDFLNNNIETLAYTNIPKK